MAKTVDAGTYEPDGSVTVASWPEGGDPPEGYEILDSSDPAGSGRVAVKKTRGQIDRDPDGNAVSVAEGATLIIEKDGRVRVLTTDEEVDQFTQTYKSAGSTAATASEAPSPASDSSNKSAS